MARCHLRHTIRDSASGATIQNALVYLYAQGTTAAITDAWNASSGGSAVTTLTSNAQGEVECWVDAPKAIDLRVTDNAGTAFKSSGAGFAFSAVTETVEALPPPADVALNANVLHTNIDDIKTSGRTEFRGAVYVKDSPIDPRSSEFGNFGANPTASAQAALDLWSQTSHPSPRLVMPSMTTTATLTGGRKNGMILGEAGKLSTVRYEGPGGVPILLLNNTGHVKVTGLSLLPVPSSGACSAAIESRYNSATNTGGAPSGMIFENLSIGAIVPAGLVDGILFSKTASSNDANNDLAEFISIYGGFGTGSLLRFTHSQSKGHTVLGIHGGQMANVVSTQDNTGNGNSGGYFTVLGGTVGACTGSAFVITAPREVFVIMGFHAEVAYRLLEVTSGTTALANIALIACSNIGSGYSVNPTTGAGTAIDPPADEIKYFYAGTLTVRGCLFRRALASGAAAPNTGKIVMALNPTLARATADISYNAWDMPGTYEVRDTLVDRQPSLGGGHIVTFNGNMAKDAGGTLRALPDRIYGAPSFLGAYSTANRPTAANDLSPGHCYFDTDLQMPFGWTGLAWRSLYTQPVSTVLTGGAAQTLAVVD